MLAIRTSYVVYNVSKSIKDTDENEYKKYLDYSLNKIIDYENLPQNIQEELLELYIEAIENEPNNTYKHFTYSRFYHFQNIYLYRLREFLCLFLT